MGTLANIDSTLATVVESLSERQLRELAVDVCEFTLRRTGVNNPAVTEGLLALRVGEYENEYHRKRLAEFVEALDQVAWSLQADVEEDRADRLQYEAAFAMARAANALLVAFNNEARAAAADVLYEAYAALGAQQEAEVPIADPRDLSLKDVAALRAPIQAALLDVVRTAIGSEQ